MKKKLFISILICAICHLPLYGCTIFSIKQDQNVYVGNNEDWNIPNPQYRIIPGVDDSYGRIVFSHRDNWGQGGMNEKGLFFDWILNSEESTTWKKDPTKKDLTGNLSEEILSKCASVEEALKYYKEFNEPIFKTSYIALVDTSGHTAFVSWNENEGKIEIENCQGICAAGYGFYKFVEKYKKLEGSIDKNKMTLLLDEAHQEGEYPTLYSNIYDLKKGLIHLYHFHNYEEEVILNLQVELKKGSHSVELKDLFKTQISKKAYRELKKNFAIKELKTIPLKGWIVVAFIVGLLVLISAFIFKLVLRWIK